MPRSRYKAGQPPQIFSCSSAPHSECDALNGLVAIPNVRGNEKMPDPTIDPTTIPVCANSSNFGEVFAATTASPPSME